MSSMPRLAPAKFLTAVLTSAAIALALSACDTGSEKDSATSEGAVTAATAEPTAGDEATMSSDGASSGFVVLPGTGSYVIGTDAPYGGYQLHGEPSEQPQGCTWSIEDADGNATFENQGQYVFLTDIKEAVTFVTEGCPDWEQFE